MLNCMEALCEIYHLTVVEGKEMATWNELLSNLTFYKKTSSKKQLKEWLKELDDWGQTRPVPVETEKGWYIGGWKLSNMVSEGLVRNMYENHYERGGKKVWKLVEAKSGGDG